MMTSSSSSKCRREDPKPVEKRLCNAAAARGGPLPRLRRLPYRPIDQGCPTHRRTTKKAGIPLHDGRIISEQTRGRCPKHIPSEEREQPRRSRAVLARRSSSKSTKGTPSALRWCCRRAAPAVRKRRSDATSPSSYLCLVLLATSSTVLASIVPSREQPGT